MSKPAFYYLPAKAYEAMLDRLEDSMVTT